MKYYKILKSSYNTKDWSGGRTTEIYKYPETSSLEERNFTVRISSATVLTEKSEFTKFNGFNRILMVLDGEVKLQHNGNKQVKLISLNQDEFSGDDETFSEGKCTDFNIISNKYTECSLYVYINGKIKTSKEFIYHIYALKDLELNFIYEDEICNFNLESGESFVCEFMDSEIIVLNESNEINCLVSEIKLLNK